MSGTTHSQVLQAALFTLPVAYLAVDVAREHRGRVPHLSGWPALTVHAAVAPTVLAAAAHGVVASGHTDEGRFHVAFFVVLALAQLWCGFALLATPGSGRAWGLAAVNAGAALTWLCSRTVGLPWPPGRMSVEPIGPLDLTVTVLEVTAVIAVAVGWHHRVGRAAPRDALRGRGVVHQSFR